MRIVLDTNVLVCALITRHTPPGILVQAWKDGRFVLVTSHEQLREFEDVYRRDRLRKFLTIKDALDLHDTIVHVAEVITNLPPVNFSPDPDDDVILGTAVAGKANLIVSRDKLHMLALKSVCGIPIVSPHEAVRRVAPA